MIVLECNIPNMIILQLSLPCENLFITHTSLIIINSFITAGKRKEGETKLVMQDILRFCTGIEIEPILGFQIPPSIEFKHDKGMSLPTANTCVNRLVLPCPENICDRNFEEGKMFKLYDMGFTSEYFGKV